MSNEGKGHGVYWSHEHGLAMCLVCGKKRNTLRSVQRHFKQKHAARVKVLRQQFDERRRAVRP